MMMQYTYSAIDIQHDIHILPRFKIKILISRFQGQLDGRFLKKFAKLVLSILLKTIDRQVPN